MEFALVVDSASAERAVVRVAGELDMSTAEELQTALAALSESRSLVIDLSECTFLDSTGVRAIASCVREGRRVSLVAVDPGIRRILEITALDTMVEVGSSLDGL